MDFSGHAWPHSGKKKLGEALCFDSVLTDTNNTLPEARDEKKKQKKKRLKTAPESISLYPLSPFSANVHVHGDV